MKKILFILDWSSPWNDQLRYVVNIELCLFLNVNLTVIFLFLFSKLGTGSRHKDGCIYRVHGKSL